MKCCTINGINYDTEFVRKVLHHDRRFRAEMKKMMSVEYDRRWFLKGVYIRWMLKCSLRNGLPEESRFPLIDARDLLVTPKLNESITWDAAESLAASMIKAIDEVVPLFGNDVINDWFASLHLHPGEWGFADAVAQIVRSELLDDIMVGITDSTKWRKHWRGGLI